MTKYLFSDPLNKEILKKKKEFWILFYILLQLKCSCDNNYYISLNYIILLLYWL